MVEEHLQECEQCRKIYQEMKTPELQIQYDRTPEESLNKYVKKKKKGLDGMKAQIVGYKMPDKSFIVYSLWKRD